jgi:dCTP deaminase
MGVIPFSTAGPEPSVVERPEFSMDGCAIVIIGADERQFAADNTECNASYDLRVGALYRDHRDDEGRTLAACESIPLLPGQAVIIQTGEEVQFPKTLFGQILPMVSLLQKGIANTPSKVAPGYSGHLLITAFNHENQTVSLKRRDKFCSLHLLSVDHDVRPYNKSAKQILGRGGVKHWRDEVYTPWILLFTLICSVIVVIQIVVDALRQILHV